jgi:hypothetical protein
MIIAAGLQILIGWILTAEVLSPAMGHMKVKGTPPVMMLEMATADQFRWAMAVIPALFIVALVVCLFLPETAPRLMGGTTAETDSAT